MARQSLRIGLLAQNSQQQYALRKVIDDSGHQVEICLLIAQLPDEAGEDNARIPLADINPNTGELPLALQVDAWVVVYDDDSLSDIEGDVINDWLDKLTIPAIICDGELPSTHEEKHQAWSRRLKEKLTGLEGTINLESGMEEKAHQVWVLGASTGGPAVVKEFLSGLPPGLGVGFVYVQHIGRGFDETLANTISKHSHYPAKLIEHGDVLSVNTVSIVSPDRATEILSNGTFEVIDEPWHAPYSPSVDCIIASVSHVYPGRCGAIIFTGMGDDGAASCRMMHQKGGKIWVQTPGSCTVDSMPLSVLEQGCVDFKGSPYALTQNFVKMMRTALHHRPAASG